MDSNAGYALLFSSATRGSHFTFERGEQQKMTVLSLQGVPYSSLLHHVPTSASHYDLSCPNQSGWSVGNIHDLTGHLIYP
jgi:hypothetical protein